MEHKAKKDMVKRFINPELCEITEDLVLTEPYNDCNHRNLVFSKNADFVKRELYDDTKLQLEVAKIKFDFMNNAQSLIHGDLHTGSIFVKQDSTRVFDPEFAFYGPMGYDIGNVVANLIFAYDNGIAAGETAFCDWALTAIVETLDLFKTKFLKVFDECVTDRMAKTPGFKEWYLSTIMSDTAAYAGTELIPPHGGHGAGEGRNHDRGRGQTRVCRTFEYPVREGLHYEPGKLPEGRGLRRGCEEGVGSRAVSVVPARSCRERGAAPFPPIPCRG